MPIRQITLFGSQPASCGLSTAAAYDRRGWAVRMSECLEVCTGAAYRSTSCAERPDSTHRRAIYRSVSGPTCGRPGAWRRRTAASAAVTDAAKTSKSSTRQYQFSSPEPARTVQRRHTRCGRADAVIYHVVAGSGGTPVSLRLSICPPSSQIASQLALFMVPSVNNCTL